MKKYKIACDVDDVLGAFYPTMCREFNKPEKQVNIWDGTDGGDCAWIAAEFPELYNNLEFWKTIPKISNPESITFNIDHYITSIPTFLHDIREQWLIDNGFPIRPLICTLDNKVDTMKALGIGVLIDDKPATIKAVREAGLIGIQFVPPYMNDYDKNDPYTIKHLSEVNKILGI
jgi:hypothetical protein